VVVGTPIGNLDDLSPRALEALRGADFIAAEDTRHTGRLLARFEIKTPQISHHKFNEASRLEGLIGRIRGGEVAALVSDAGMPGISDPGERVIARCREEGLPVEVIPGPCAVIHALVASGFPATPFYFGGFLPVKSGRRQKEVETALSRGCTVVYYESPHRLLRTLACFDELDPRRRLCVGRELTKKFEECPVGFPGELLDYFGEKKIKGEITLVVAPSSVQGRSGMGVD
jgi:16S rRNA (cytidine1402-2'-O)-methyltransferase